MEKYVLSIHLPFIINPDMPDAQSLKLLYIITKILKIH